MDQMREVINWSSHHDFLDVLTDTEFINEDGHEFSYIWVGLASDADHSHLDYKEYGYYIRLSHITRASRH